MQLRDHSTVYCSRPMDSDVGPSIPFLADAPLTPDKTSATTDRMSRAQAAIPAFRELAADAHGWAFPTPKIHRSNEATVDFIEELCAQRLSLAVDDSYDVDQHHERMTNYLSGRIVPQF